MVFFSSVYKLIPVKISSAFMTSNSTICQPLPELWYHQPLFRIARSKTYLTHYTPDQTPDLPCQPSPNVSAEGCSTLPVSQPSRHRSDRPAVSPWAGTTSQRHRHAPHLRASGLGFSQEHPYLRATQLTPFFKSSLRSHLCSKTSLGHCILHPIHHS